MLLWLTFAILAAIVLVAVLAPLVRENEAPELPASAADMAVYRDQLREVDAEVESGLITAGEAEAAKTEVSRRLLQHADSGKFLVTAKGKARGALAAGTFYAALVLIPGLALSLYLWVGSPNLPGQPFAARTEMPVTARAQAPAASQGIESLIAQVEQALQKNPRDGRAWDALAPVYLKIGRAADAVHAFARAIELLGETPQRLTGFAESEVIASKGIVTKKARKAFRRIEALAPGRPVVRYWLAVAMEQDGKLKAAGAEYRALLKGAKPDAPWRHIVEKQLAQLNAKLAGKDAPKSEKMAQAAKSKGSSVPAVRGPTREQIEDGMRMSAGDQTQFVNQMVAGLEEKLKANADNLPRWMMLVRSYSNLERRNDAMAALAKARKQFAGNAEALAALDGLATQFGLGP